jgi:hypothetical protein
MKVEKSRIERILISSIGKLFLALILFSLLSLIATDYQSTSKVSWEENRGVPFTFLVLEMYDGPCDVNEVCKNAQIKAFYSVAFLFDFMLMYLGILAVSFLFSRKLRWRLTPHKP